MKRLLVVAALAACHSTQSIELDGARANVPSSWGVVTDGRPEKIEAAARREDPKSEISLLTKGPDGQLGVALMHVTQSEEYSRGTTIPQMMTAIEQALREAAQKQGSAADANHECDDHQCTLHYTVGAMIAQVREWRVRGRIVGTSCTAWMKSVAARCELPPAPANAIAQ